MRYYKVLTECKESVTLHGTHACLIYGLDRWTTAPLYLAERGYHPLVFSSIREAVSTDRFFGWDGCLWAIYVRGVIDTDSTPRPLTRQGILDTNSGALGNLFGSPTCWPGGTIMVKKVKLARYMGRCRHVDLFALRRK